MKIPKYKQENGKFHPLYNSWYAMKRRCNNTSWKQYKDYGGRGITYAKAWESYESFAIDMFPTWKLGLTLDRMDNNGNYYKENCKWSSNKEQNSNKRSNHILEYKGRKMTMPQWAEYFGMNFGTLRSRFYRGMNLEEILNGKLFRPQKINL